VSTLLQKTLTKKCRKMKIPEAIRVRKDGPKNLYSLTVGFASEFGIMLSGNELEDHFSNPRHRKMLEFMAKYPMCSVDEVSEEMKITVDNVRRHVRNINKILESIRLPEITVVKKGVKSRPRYVLSPPLYKALNLKGVDFNEKKDLEAVVNTFLEFRIENGRWPKLIDLRRVDGGIQSKVRRTGGMKTAMRIVSGSSVSNENREILERMSRVIGEWDFSIFGEEHELVKKALFYALNFGASLRELERIVEDSKKVRNVYDRVRYVVVEANQIRRNRNMYHDSARARPASILEIAEHESGFF